jgi:hypothetical protein
LTPHRFDFPGRWPDLLQNLLAAADWSSELNPKAKLRALKALKQIFTALVNKRFVVEQPARGMVLQPANMRALTQQLNAERESFRTLLSASFEPLAKNFSQHAVAFLGANGDWQAHGLFARAAAAAISRLQYLLTSGEAMPAGSPAFLEQLHSASGALLQGRPQGGLPGCRRRHLRLPACCDVTWLRLPADTPLHCCASCRCLPG